MELTKRQREVIDLMGEGWALKYSKFGNSAFLRGIRLEQIKWVNLNTLNSLGKRGLIKIESTDFKRTIYKLTDKAKEL